MIEELKKLESEGYVRSVKHKELPLTIWNYTPKTQYEKAFGDFPILRSCRGLVLDDEGKVWARPLPKFYNYEEHELSELPFEQDIEVTCKMDGSLLIVFRYGEEVVYTTRGSFYSDQAIFGCKLFRELYDENTIENGLTYLFELIGPDNRIVVSYEQNDLVHLALLDTNNGHDLPRDERFKCVKVYEVEGGKLDSDGGIFGSKVYKTLKFLNTANEEGFVIRAIGNEFKPDWRCKIKFSDYCELHRLITNFTNISVWECLKKKTDFEELLKNTPDEFYNFVRKTKLELESEFNKIFKKGKLISDSLKNIESRKEQAIIILNNDEYKEYSAVIFKMLNENSTDDLIWQIIKPKVRICPFKDEA